MGDNLNRVVHAIPLLQVFLLVILYKEKRIQCLAPHFLPRP